MVTALTVPAAAPPDAVLVDGVEALIAERTKVGLVRYLGSLRRAFPDLRLEPRQTFVQHDRVVALVDAAELQPDMVLSVPHRAAVAYWNDGPDAMSFFLVTISPT